MKKTNNIWGNTSKFLAIMILSLIFVGCSTVEDKTVIANTTDIVGTTITAVSTKAGITAFTITDFVAPTVSITFDTVDNTKALQEVAVKNSIVESLTTDVELKNMHTVYDDVVYVVSDVDSATVTVTFKAKDGFEFEDKTTAKTVTITLSGVFITGEPPVIGSIYIITLPEHLTWLSGRTVARDIQFNNNINMNNIPFAGIKEFSGTMDGTGYSIQNLKIDNANRAGLILVLNGGTIQNLTIGDSSPNSSSIKGRACTGAFVAESRGTVNLISLTNRASVEFSLIAGGMIGKANGKATISHAENSGKVIGIVAGGMIGGASGEATINYTKNSGVIDGSSAGGMMGLAENLVNINYAQNTGEISGLEIGGMIGMAGDVTINISHSYYQAQKLVGKTPSGSEPTITASYYLDDTAAVGVVDAKLTTAEFKVQANFIIGWDFTGINEALPIWEMGTLYPELK